MLSGSVSVLDALASAFTWSEEQVAAHNVPADLVQQAAAAASALREGSAAVLAATTTLPREAIQRMQRIVRQAVAVVQQFCELPDQVQTVRLAHASAAAGRSCAYLRCANVAAPGGPDAGPGTGSKCYR